jgi:hypothetical protein
MSKEDPPVDYEKMIKAQELIIRGEITPEESEGDSKYTSLPEGVTHPTEIYDTSLPNYSKRKRPDWLKIIEIGAPPSKPKLDEEEGQ